MPTILIVEDDMELAGLISHALRKGGYEVKVAPDGIQAMNLARQMKPDLVILDYMFPAGGGASFHKRFRLSIHTGQTPILLLTAAPEADVLAAIGNDAKTSFMSKPYYKEDLLKRVGELLGGAH